jgi:hypothetical protein
MTSDRPERLSDEDVAFYAQDSTIYRSTTPPVQTAIELLAREVQSSRARITELERLRDLQAQARAKRREVRHDQ